MNDLTNPIFHNETKAREWLEARCWPDGPVCPHCGEGDATALKGEAHRAGLYQCNACRKQFTVTVGTLFERSKISLTKWVMAIYLLSASKNGMSSNQLSRMLGLPYKTAWFMTHRIRAAMREGSFGQLGGGNKTVKVDETYVGPTLSTRKSRNVCRKEPVVALVERGGKVRSMHVEDVNVKHLKRYLGEFDFRYDTRNVDDMARASLVAKGIQGKRLTYRRTGEGQARASEAHKG